MSYATAVVTSSATPSTALMTAIEAELTTHTAWDYVEERVSGSYTFRVWKCLGTYNSHGSDFYIALYRTTSGIGTSGVSAVAFEGYDTGTGYVTRACPPANAAAYTPDSTYDAWPSGTGVALSTLTGGTLASVNTSTVTFTYRIFVSKDRLMFRTSLSAADWVYVGLFEPLGWPGVTTEFPLIVAYSLSSGGFTSMSRCPHKGTRASRSRPGYATGSNWASSAPSTSYAPGLPTSGTIGTSYVGLYTTPFGNRAAVLDSNAPSGYGSTCIRGQFYGWLSFNDPGYAEGDTITVDGVQHVRLTAGQFWMSVAD